MLTVDFYLIDAFTQHTFGGNAAAVCPLTAWLPDERLLQMARQHNQSEKAFFVPSEQGFALRWFTTQGEINLCGHATRAAAHVIFTAMGYAGDTIRFSTWFVGELTVTRSDAWLTLDFPAWQAEPVTPPALLLRCLGIDAAV
ncbi:PhzF family phenazine biosynthesis protein, partial [Candidatus Symbiopectobacterium endolongispinus]|uniref:PhzF family phenazine biosynthesis protein n=1 Tax=Candidatus Symbiopectobacterium endolongispinus TaxID=2812664 RepID=UPI002079FBF1